MDKWTEDADISIAIDGVVSTVEQQIESVLDRDSLFKKRVFLGIAVLFALMGLAIVATWGIEGNANKLHVDKWHPANMVLLVPIALCEFVAWKGFQLARRPKTEYVAYERQRGLRYAISDAFDETLAVFLQQGKLDAVTAGALATIRDRFGYIPYAYWTRVVDVRTAQGANIPKALAGYRPL